MVLCSTPIKSTEISFSYLNLSTIKQPGLVPIVGYQKTKSCTMTPGLPESLGSTPTRKPIKNALRSFSRLFSRKKNKSQNKTKLAAAKIRNKYLAKQISMRSIEFWEEDYETLTRRSSTVVRTLPI